MFRRMAEASESKSWTLSESKNSKRLPSRGKNITEKKLAVQEAQKFNQAESCNKNFRLVRTANSEDFFIRSQLKKNSHCSDHRLHFCVLPRRRSSALPEVGPELIVALDF